MGGRGYGEGVGGAPNGISVPRWEYGDSLLNPHF